MNVTAPILVLAVCVGLAPAASAQDIRILSESREVVVPFSAFTPSNQIAGCTMPLQVREDGKSVEVSSVTPAEQEPITIGMILSLGGMDDAIRRSIAFTAWSVAALDLGRFDGCVIAHASTYAENIESEVRGTKLGAGRDGCVAFLVELARKPLSPILISAIQGVNPDTERAFSKISEELKRERQLRKAILIIGTGEDQNLLQYSKVAKAALKDLTPVYVLHFDPYAPNQVPEARRRREKALGTSTLGPTDSMVRRMAETSLALRKLAESTGGQYAAVTESTAGARASAIIAGLRQQCLLTFRPSDSTRRGPRRIELIAGKEYRLQHRTSYDPSVLLPAPSK